MKICILCDTNASQKSNLLSNTLNVRGGPHLTLHEIQEWQQLVSDGDRSLYQVGGSNTH